MASVASVLLWQSNAARGIEISGNQNVFNWAIIGILKISCLVFSGVCVLVNAHKIAVGVLYIPWDV